MKKYSSSESDEDTVCAHENVKQDSGYYVCQDCGEVLEEGDVVFEQSSKDIMYSDKQRDYESKIKKIDSKAIQDPTVKQKYDKIKILDKWFRDYKTSFTKQKQTIEKFKNHGITITTDNFNNIKDRYLRYNKNHRKNYQNMVIIFLAIVWKEIKETTNIRVDGFITLCNTLGHKINKKMLNRAMLKVKKTEIILKQNKLKNAEHLEKDIKERIKILFQKNLNKIPFEKVKTHFLDNSAYEKLKIEMLLKAANYLEEIPYTNIRNTNFKAFTAGLIYYVGQTILNNKIFTQSLIETTTHFSATTIRKKYHQISDILGAPNPK